MNRTRPVYPTLEPDPMDFGASSGRRMPRLDVEPPPVPVEIEPPVAPQLQSPQPAPASMAVEAATAPASEAAKPVRLSNAVMTEVIGSSTSGFDDAVRQGMQRASTILPQAAEAVVRDFRVGIREDGALEYRVTLMVPVVLS